MNSKPNKGPRPMRLMEVLEPSGGGSGRHFLDLCQGMQARGHVVHAVYSPVRADRRFIEELVSLGLAGMHAVTMERVPGPTDFAAWWRLRAVMRRAGPFDIIHGHSSKAGALSRIRLPGRHVPRVYTPHAFRTMDPGLSLVSRKVYGSIEKLLARAFTDRLICVSADEYAHARALGMPRDRLSIVVNGVDTPPSDTRDAIRAGLGIPHDALVFGFVGRLTHQKAPERLIAAFALAADQLPNARLMMIGNGEMQGVIRRQIEACPHAPRIHLTNDFTGPQAMAALDVLVVPSRYEAMSYAMLEAAAAGKPLILSNVGGASTVLKHGENGLLVANDDDPEHLSAAMLALSLPERLARHAAAAHARSCDYGLERMIGETEAIYRGLIA